MDPLTHGLIGISLSAFSGHTLQISDPVVLGCTFGAMIPDLDIINYCKGRLNYLLKHRGASHSLVVTAAMSAFLSVALHTLFPGTPFGMIFLWTLIGVLSHVIIDVLNSYGAELLWPFVKKKFTINTIVLMDPGISLFFFSAMIATVRFPHWAYALNLGAFLASGLLLSGKILTRLKIRNRLIRDFHLTAQDEVKVFPALYRTFKWNYLIIQDSLIRFGTIRRGMPVLLRSLPVARQEDPYLAAVMDGMLANIFDQFTPYYYVSLRHTEDEREYQFLDLRYWTKGDFFYSGKVVLGANGEITEEAFIINPKHKNIALEY
jgi:inner membrane protein